MATEMELRVAKAVEKVLIEWEVSPYLRPAWDVAQPIARAALEAIAVPTEAMLIAGGDALDPSGDREFDLAGPVWTAMIRAALTPEDAK